MMNNVCGVGLQNPSIGFKGKNLKAMTYMVKAVSNPDEIVHTFGQGDEVFKLLKDLKNPIWALGGKDAVCVISGSKIAEIYEDASANIGRNGKKYASPLEEAKEKVKFKTGIPEIDAKWLEKLKELKYIKILEDIIEGRKAESITQEQALRYMDALDKIK